MTTRALSTFLLSVAFSMNAGGQVSPPDVPQDLAEYVERVLTTFDVPGIGLAIVKDGRVVAARGFGVRRLGTTDRVDGRTQFAIASNSKAFTATSVAMLVEAGKLDWDAPVIRYLPWFQMSDPYVTSHLTVKDLLVHRSGLGLGAGDLLWWPPTTYTRREIAERLRNVPLARSFRSAYAYDNVLYTVAGELIEAVSGLTWEEFVTTRILEPLRMTHTTVRHSLAGTGVDAASPHAFVDDTVRVVSPFVGDVTNPQGGINTCAEDIAQWLIVQLDSGRVAGAPRLFPSSTTRTLWSMVTPMPIPAPVGPLNQGFRGYALGFVLEDYRGEFTVSHTGSLPGYVSRLVMVPAMKLGIAVLTNQESRDAYESIIRNLLDYYLHAKPVDWITAFKQREESRTAARQQPMAGDSVSGPSLPLKRYAGLYTDPWYGDMRVSERGNDLQIRFVQTPVLNGTLVHWERDTFVARWDQRELRADAFVTFVMNAFGRIDHVTMKPVSPETDFSYDFHDLRFVPTPGREH